MNKIRPLFFANVSKGVLKFVNPAELTRYLSQLEGEVEVSIQKKRKKRSTAENNYYWGVVVEMVAEKFGYDDTEQAHEALKLEFLKIHREDRPDTVGSTKKLSTVEMEDYLSRIRICMARDWELDIPEPNEADYEGWQ